MYCEKCFVVYESERCPICGSRRGRESAPDDFCLLTEKDVFWGGMLEDVLKQNGIPYFTKHMWGAGMTVRMGYLLENVSFFVPMSQLSQARQLVEELFSEKETDEAEEAETE